MKSQTVIVNKRFEQYDIYIGRPSKWGNPFSHLDNTRAEFHVATRQDAVEAYRKWILTQSDLLNSLGELEGKRLGCWCKPLACHGDVLIELIEERYGTA